eukprot:337435-Chlamydomonas_euryale.AAC.1
MHARTHVRADHTCTYTRTHTRPTYPHPQTTAMATLSSLPKHHLPPHLHLQRQLSAQAVVDSPLHLSFPAPATPAQRPGGCWPRAL